MKTMKKIVALLAVALMLCSIMPMAATSVAAAEVATSLSVGDVVVLTCPTKNMELSSVGSSYGNGTGYSSTPAGTYKLTVEAGYASGTYAFKTDDGKYLYWDSGNSLKTTSSVTQNSSWKVTFSGTSVTIVNAKDNSRKLQWNASSPRFACYTSSQTAVQLYKLSSGSTPACEHENKTHTDATDKSCTEDGNIEYWYCEDCKTYFSDEACAETITEDATVIPAGHTYGDDTICDVCGDELEDYVLVTDASVLKAGDKIIIVGNNTNYAMSTEQKTNNRGVIKITKNGDIISSVDGLQEITLEAGLNGGEFAFSTEAGYLYAASSSSNHLKSQTNINANASWTISITDGVASIVAPNSSNRKVMQYNPNNGTPMFSCYASASQTALNVYYMPGVAPSCTYNHNALPCGGECPECDYVNANTHAYTSDYDVTCNNCDYVRTDITLPDEGEALSIEQAIAIGAGLDKNEYTTNKYYITGTITGTYLDSWATYGNFNISDGENTILIFGLSNYDGSVRYDAMENKPVVGDEITVYGVIGNYNGTAQMKNGWLDEFVAHKHDYDNAHDNECSICGGANPDYKAECVSNAAYPCVAGKCMYCDKDMDATADHDYGEGEETLSATCDLTGEMTYTCKCGDSYTETIPAWHDGNLIYTPAADAIDCANPGNIENYFCPDCCEYFSDAYAQEILNPWYIEITMDCVRPEGIADCADVICETCGNEIYGYGEHDVLACQGGTCSKCNAEIEGYGCQNLDTPACEDGVCYYCGGFVAGFGHENGAWAPCLDGECSYGCGLQYPATADHVDADADDYCDECYNHLACVDADADDYCDICWTEMPCEHVYDHAYDATCNACGETRNVMGTIANGGMSVSEDVRGLAARFNVSGIYGLAIKPGYVTQVDYTNATIDGKKVVGMGAIADNGKMTQDIPCVYLWSLGGENGEDDGTASFAVRIINIPEGKEDVEITFTAYIDVVEDGETARYFLDECSGTYNTYLVTE